MEPEKTLKSCVNWYDYGARIYDPALGRWHTPDALSEYAFNQSSYNYVDNNPIRYIDPDGNFKSEFDAWNEWFYHGGEGVYQDKESGEWYVSRRRKYEGEGFGVAVERCFDPTEEEFDWEWGAPTETSGISFNSGDSEESSGSESQPFGFQWTDGLGNGPGVVGKFSEYMGSINDFLSGLIKVGAGKFRSSSLDVDNPEQADPLKPEIFSFKSR